MSAVLSDGIKNYIADVIVPLGLNVMLIVLTSPIDEVWSKLVTRPLKTIFLAAALLALSGNNSKDAVPASPVTKAASTNAAVSPEAALS